MTGANGGNVAEAAIGFAVTAVAVGFLAFAMTQTGGMGAGRGGYALSANFDRADGIAAGADVRMSGVKVGAVSQIGLDPQSFQAQVKIAMDTKVQVPQDSVARVATDGLLGGAYVSIEPGGSADMLKPGQQFESTQGSVDLLTLFASFAGGAAGDGGKAPEAEAVP